MKRYHAWIEDSKEKILWSLDDAKNLQDTLLQAYDFLHHNFAFGHTAYVFDKSWDKLVRERNSDYPNDVWHHLYKGFSVDPKNIIGKTKTDRFYLQYANNKTAETEKEPYYPTLYFTTEDIKNEPKTTKPMAKKSNEEKPLHIAIYIGKFRVYRVFRTCEALHRYVKAILDKGYTAFGTEYNGKTEKWEQFKTNDWNTMCSEIFEYGLILRKTAANGKKSEIKIYEHKPQPKKRTK